MHSLVDYISTAYQLLHQISSIMICELEIRAESYSCYCHAVQYDG